MHVFISWSGDTSRQIAVAIQEWLPAVLQAVKPFVSDRDIHSGTRWQSEVVDKLDSSQFGIVCVTAENQNQPWLQFEAGALSKSIEDSRVVPILFDMSKSDLLLPLNMFQAETLDANGIGRLLTSLNASLVEPLEASTLKSLAEMWWPKLEEKIIKIRDAVSKPGEAPPNRTDREILEEIVTTVRAIRRNSGTTSTARSRGQGLLAEVRENFPGVSLRGKFEKTTVVSGEELPEPDRYAIMALADKWGANIDDFVVRSEISHSPQPEVPPEEPIF